MKKILSMFIVTVILILNCGHFVGCSIMPSDDAILETTFYYSSDDGANYRPEAKRFEIGTPMLMKIVITAAGTKLKSQTINGTLFIPNEAGMVFLDAKGAKVEESPSASDTIYDFSISADFVSTSALNQVELIFAFVPKEEAKHTFTVAYDDQVEPKYDRHHSILFVADEIVEWE